MGLISKAITSAVVKTVVDSTSGTGGANKNDVKMAKLELKKAKMEQENAKKQDEMKEIIGIVRYIGTNITIYENQISSLLAETQNSLNSYQSASIFKKSNYQSVFEDNLKYVYLSKTFFSLLSKVASGMRLTDNQNVFIIRFNSYFDGIKVLSEDYTNESLVDSFKEMGSEIASMFVSSSKKPFSFEDYLNEYNERKSTLEIPDVQSSIMLFKKMYSEFKINDENTSVENENKNANKSTICPECKTPISADNIYCPKCGTNVSQQIRFCGKCGNKCATGISFCTSCGAKL